MLVKWYFLLKSPHLVRTQTPRICLLWIIGLIGIAKLLNRICRYGAAVFEPSCFTIGIFIGHWTASYFHYHKVRYLIMTPTTGAQWMIIPRRAE